MQMRTPDVKTSGFLLTERACSYDELQARLCSLMLCIHRSQRIGQLLLFCFGGEVWGVPVIYV